MKTLKIALADDHPIIVKGVSSLINNTSFYEVIFTAENKNELLEKLKIHTPDILILDVVMPDVSATELFSDIIQFYPELSIIAYTSLNSPMLIKMLFRNGVKGFVNKNDPPEELLEAIESIRRGNNYVAESYSHLINKKSIEETPEISKREKEILLLIAEQYTTTAIAEKLFISVNTVESHRKKLFEKFNVENLAGLIREAMRQGYLH